MSKQQLVDNIKSKKSFLCIGLDTDIDKIPTYLLDETEDPIYLFNKKIVDFTAKYCVAYKLNSAFYESYGVKGIVALEKTIEYIRTVYPDQLIILDAKRGDIGNTSAMYASAAFKQLKASAVTVAPYMGEDSVKPFLAYADKWVIILALTSNEGSQDFQVLKDENGERLFETVLKKSQKWGTEDQIMYVVGATQAEMFEDVRKYAPNHFLLVPGIGVQGGSLDEIVEYGMNKECGLLVSASRSIIYASDGDDFARAAGEEAQKMQEEMAKYLEAIF